ncbi:MAG: HEPN domain-containing protein, partial [Candidatus Hydrogenedentes bacterium]|nr:HEPN domain-containing protein [Candidatus Hydrogenedentota bacterium]
MNAVAKRWAEQAQYDLETARAMLASHRYHYVLFCCQQAIEKALKALIAEQTREMPPRIHNLLKLAELAKVELEIKRKYFLEELSAYYIRS